MRKKSINSGIYYLLYFRQSCNFKSPTFVRASAWHRINYIIPNKRAKFKYYMSMLRCYVLCYNAAFDDWHCLCGEQNCRTQMGLDVATLAGCTRELGERCHFLCARGRDQPRRHSRDDLDGFEELWEIAKDRGQWRILGSLGPVARQIGY